MEETATFNFQTALRLINGMAYALDEMAAKDRYIGQLEQALNRQEQDARGEGTEEQEEEGAEAPPQAEAEAPDPDWERE